MKIPPILRLICAAVALGVLLVGGCILTDSKPSYPELKASCDDALSKSPTSATLETWLNMNRISPQRLTGPFNESFKRILVSNGISVADADRAASCTYFGSLHVRGGVLSSHVAYGYFVFTSDGGLIDYSIHSIQYGM